MDPVHVWAHTKLSIFVNIFSKIEKVMKNEN